MFMLKNVLVAAGLAIVALLAFVGLQPDRFTVVRSTVIEAPPSAVYALVRDFRQWPKWSPWEDLDPDMERTFAGTQGEEGAVYAWSGDKAVGKGTMKTLRLVNNQRMEIELLFIEPFPGDSLTSFVLEPTEGGTKVTWDMDADAGGMMGKAMGLVMDMDAIIGADYQKGLAKLGEVAKASSSTTAASAAIGG